VLGLPPVPPADAGPGVPTLSGAGPAIRVLTPFPPSPPLEILALGFGPLGNPSPAAPAPPPPPPTV